MKKKKTDREVLREIFPKEIVKEVEAVIEDVDKAPRRAAVNPDGKSKRLPKPWGRKWVEERKPKRRK